MKRTLLILLAAACPSARVVKPPHPPARADAGAIVDAAIIEAGPSKLELLAAGHDRIAPGTREILRREVDASKENAITLPAFEADTCVRVAFDAETRTQITLENAQSLKLGTLDKTEGVLGPTGPICVRKGDAVTIRFNGQSAVRLVVWASP